jgi:short-subunit dehydrogenase
MDINGARVVVTGASSGIGAELAPQLAAAGARSITVVARRAFRLATVAERIRATGAEAHVIAADLSHLDRAEAVIDEAAHAMGGIDILVNNAAMGKRKHLLDTSTNELDQVMRTNFMSPVRMAMRAIPAMLEQGRGCVAMVGSMGGRLGIARESAYCASKFAMSGWTEVAFEDLFQTPIQMKLILPGPIETEIWDTQPGELAGMYAGPFVSAADCAASIVEAIADDGFEYYVPPEVTDGFVQHDLVVGKTTDVDGFLSGMAAMADEAHA